MKTLLLSVSFLISVAGGALADDRYMDTLEVFQPLHVEQADGVLSVVLPQRQITDTIFQAVVTNTLCAAVQLDRLDLDGVSQIDVFNQFGAQGWTFEGGRDDCLELADIKGEARKVFVLGRSHVFTRSSDPYVFPVQ